MKQPPIKLFAGALVALLVAQNPSAQAAGAAQDVQATLDKLLTAIKADDRSTFLADATDTMKAAITQQVMDAVSAQFGPRLKKEFQATYLTDLNEKGVKVYLWKLTFKDGGDDLIAKVALQDGKVAGFFFE